MGVSGSNPGGVTSGYLSFSGEVERLQTDGFAHKFFEIIYYGLVKCLDCGNVGAEIFVRSASNAPVVELVDTQDLKSCLLKSGYGFNSRLGHKFW